MKKQLLISIWMTLATTILLGVVYPLVVTGIAQVLFPAKANGSLILAGKKTIGSHMIGQPFTSSGYFHSRPSAAGPAGYDGTASGGSNLAPTNKALLDRVDAEVRKLHAENRNMPIPVDLVTASGSGLDPHISLAAAEFQIPRVARERSMSEAEVRVFVKNHSEGRQFGFLGEPRVNVLELNLDLDAARPRR
ncbi:MAG TPA: potassium-transporting ATPase subunit KdpC [Candidatus Acidoferrales bacterium]|nr:potassium-transporting ATPase subunit KdpC [Candidatus Acidoferrales bacterium]